MKWGLHMSDFNLIDSKWLLVRKNSTVEKVSLRELFSNTHEYDSLAGEMPTQDFAILRLLLAIMYASLYTGVKEKKDARALWKYLYNTGNFDMNIINAYFDKWYDRFYLFDDKYPFYQVPGLISKRLSVVKLNGQISESENKTRLFCLYAGDEKGVLSFDEAARWLINIMSYDDVGERQSSESKTEAGGTVSVGVGWLGKIGGVFLTGKNLFETLMLNFVVLDHNNNIWNIGKAAWEREVRRGERTPIIPPSDPLTLFTIQSRRVELIPNGGNVNQFSLFGGDFFSGENYFIETMTAFRETKNRIAKFVPLKHDFGKQMWRSADTLLLRLDSQNKPLVIKQLVNLIDKEIIPINSILIHTVGISYKKADSAVDDIYSDALRFNTKLLTEMDISLRERISNEIAETERIVKAYGRLAAELYISSGGVIGKNGDTFKAVMNAAKEYGYALLDIEFRNWFDEISAIEKEDMEKSCGIWQLTSRRILQNAADTLIGEYGLQIFQVTKEDKITNTKEYDDDIFDKKNKHANAYKAVQMFERRLGIGR
jgi:CRISPR system Cascade subunit CasA